MNESESLQTTPRLPTPPFFSKGSLGQEDDARRFGWTMEEHDFWQPHSCGTCCLKMIGDGVGATPEVDLAQLTEMGMQNGMFRCEQGAVLGAFHHPMADILRRWGLIAEVLGFITLEEIAEAVTAGAYVMLSVDLMRLPNNPIDDTHLVLVFAFQPESRRFTIHDSASVLGPHGDGLEIAWDVLDRLSNARGLLVAAGPDDPQRSA